MGPCSVEQGILWLRMWNTFSLPQLSLVLFTSEIFIVLLYLFIVFTQASPKPTSKVYKSEALLTQSRGRVWNHLSQLEIQQPLEPDRILPPVLIEMADGLMAWELGKVLNDWKKASVIPVLKMGQKGDLVSKVISLTSVLWKILEQVLLKDTPKYLRDKRVTSNRLQRASHA